MPEPHVSQLHVTPDTPLGATLVAGGVTFRTWAPAATAVYVVTDELPASRAAGWRPNAKDALVAQGDGTWAGFVPGVGDGAPYRFWIDGAGDAGFKRDPYARELGTDPPFPDCDCLVHDPARYPWHDASWRTPPARDLVIYQLHIGTFNATNARGDDVRHVRRGTFLDVLERLSYLRELGINAIQPLPVQEFPSRYSMGYNGTDYFSPESDYQVEDSGELARHLANANAILASFGQPPLVAADIRAGPDQLRCLVDCCHLLGIAVLFDVVYNHAGGGFDDQGLWFYDRRTKRFDASGRITNNDESLYFSTIEWAGGFVFDYASPMVRRLLVDNARFLLDEFHGDGLRWDEVTVIDRCGGWLFAQEATAAVRADRPHAVQVAEYWNDPGWRWQAVTPPPEGMGFDAALDDGLRDAIRHAVGVASQGRDAHVPVEALASRLALPWGFAHGANVVQCVENHDVVFERTGDDRRDWKPRLAHLADANDPRSWWARSRARVATALLLTAPGIPMLFMGQEILEDRNWSDNPDHAPDTLVRWERLVTDRVARDFHDCTRDLLALRHAQGALRGDRIRVTHASDADRVLAFHRWVDDGSAPDVLVVASFAEDTWRRYDVGFPWPGAWREAFNSDWYDGEPNPVVAGNGGTVHADGPPLHEFAQSASIVIPANGVVVFVRA